MISFFGIFKKWSTFGTPLLYRSLKLFPDIWTEEGSNLFRERSHITSSWRGRGGLANVDTFNKIGINAILNVDKGGKVDSKLSNFVNIICERSLSNVERPMDVNCGPLLFENINVFVHCDTQQTVYSKSSNKHLPLEPPHLKLKYMICATVGLCYYAIKRVKMLKKGCLIMISSCKANHLLLKMPPKSENFNKLPGRLLEDLP